MLTMHSKIQEENHQAAPAQASRQGELLKGMFAMLQSWQRKGLSPEEIQKAAERLYGLIQAKMGDKMDSGKLDLKYVFELLLSSKLNLHEKELIQALFLETAHLKKQLMKGDDHRAVMAKNKNRYKHPVQKKFI